jgi:hypothetical protein
MFERELMLTHRQEEHDRLHHEFLTSTDGATRKRLIQEHDAIVGPDHWSYMCYARTHSPLPSPYFGSQGRYIEPLLKLLVHRHPDMHAISDATSGSNAPMYLAKRMGLRVRTNDWCHMSYFVSRAVVVANHEPPNMVSIDPERVVPVPGFVKSLELFPYDVATYIDGVATLALAHDDPLTLAALAGTLVSGYTYRGMCYDKNWCREATLVVFHNRLLKRRGLLQAAILRDQPEGEAFNLDAEDFVSLPGEHDTLYMDFAWPWTTGAPVDTYDFFSRDISSVLLQKPLEKHQFTTKEDIVPKILAIWKKALGHYNRLILSTQSTNYPPGDQLEEVLLSEFGPRCKYHTFYDVVSSVNSKPFRELVYVVER